ncbi:MAG: hypothetical protein RI910_435 [Verrucomicrobiota bacterium]|jgi:hypothetical protein
MRISSLAAYGLAFLLSLTAIGHAAQDDNSGIRKEPAGGAMREIKTAQALILVNTRVDDRRLFDALIRKEYPSSGRLYTSVDKNVDRSNAAYEMLFGTRPDILVERGHDTLVIIGNFRDSSVQLAGETYEQSMKYWVEKFTPSEKHKAIKLVLLSTDKKPSEDLIMLTEISGGSYRKLTVGKDGSYE